MGRVLAWDHRAVVTRRSTAGSGIIAQEIVCVIKGNVDTDCAHEVDVSHPKSCRSIEIPSSICRCL